MAKSDKVVKRGVYLYLDGSPIQNDIKTIEAEMRGLVVTQKKMVIGSEEYVRTGEKIRALKGIILQHNNALKATGDQLNMNATEAARSDSRMRTMANGFSRYFSMITSFIASITGVFYLLKKAVGDYLQMDSAYSDVMKYTGLSRDQVVDLNENLKKMDTRTARLELNKLLADAGKIGVEGKKNLLEFAEAGDIIRVSLGEDLGEDAIKNIGKLAEMFGDADKLGLKKAMLSIGSVINQLASTTTSDEKYLVDFTGRLAGIGKQAKLDIPIIAAYGSVLDQDMQQVEMSATALQGVMMKIFQNPGKMAKIAGMEVKAFTKLVKTDANEALLQFLATLGKKGDMMVLAPMFEEMKLDGARASQVLSVLAGNVGKIRDTQKEATQAFNDATSVVNEFNIKNNDATAQNEKQKKVLQEIVYTLGEKLLPLYTTIISSTSSLASALGVLIEFSIKYGGVIITLTSSIAGYYLALKIGVAWQNRMTIAQNASAVGSGLLKGSLYLLQVAYFLLTGQMSKARGAMVAFNLVTGINPLAALAAVLTAVTVAVIYFTRKVDMATAAQNAMNKVSEQAQENIQKEQDEVNILLKIAGDEYASKEQRLGAIKRLNQISPEYLGNLSLEAWNTDQAKASVDEYVESLLTLAKLQGAKDRLSAIPGEIEKLKELNKEGETFIGAVKNFPRNLGSMLTWGAIDTSGEDISYKIAKLQAEEKKLSGFVKSTVQEQLSGQKTKTKKEPADTGSGGGGGEDLTDKEQKEALVQIDVKYNAKRAALKKQYLDGDIQTQAEYNRKMEELELEVLNAKLKVAGIEPAKRNEIQQQILDARVKVNDALKQLDEKAYVSPEEKNRKELDALKKKYDDMAQVIQQAYDMKIIPTEEEYKAKLTELSKQQAKEETDIQEKIAKDTLDTKDKAHEKELFLLNEKRMNEKWTEKKYNNELRRLELSFIEDNLSTLGLSEEQKTELMKQWQDIRLEQTQESNEKEVEKQKEYSQLIEDIMVGFAEETASLFTDSEATMGDYIKKLTLLMIDALERMVQIKMAEVTVSAIAGGPLAWIAAAAKIAAIKAAFAAVKVAVSNFYDGGYTPGGAWDKPQGIVHSNEFVSNRFAVGNPQLRPVFDLIDYAQKSGSVANLTGSDIAAVLPANSSTGTKNNSTKVVTQTSQSSSDTAMHVLLLEVNNTMKTVKERFDSPIVAETYATGRGGTIAAQKLVDKMITNVSRKKN